MDMVFTALKSGPGESAPAPLSRIVLAEVLLLKYKVA